MTREMVFGLLGGLGLFLYGMTMMGDGLQKAAGDKLRRILEALTGKTWKGVVAGTVVTSVIQSSSATTVMLVSFVNAGLMSLTQAFGVIMGANIGTTITAQIIAFKITEWALPAIGIGFLIRFLGKRRTTKYVGQVVLGFGILFLGMHTMESAVAPLRHSSIFVDLMTQLGAYPVLGVLVGLVMTAVIQSSSASTGILLAVAGEMPELMTLDVSLPILFGCNIGTCVTALLASMGANRTAKRAALAHIVFNVVGSILFLFLLGPFEYLVRAVSGTADMQRLIANSHTLFNVLNTILWFPFTGLMVKIVTGILPGPDRVVTRDAKYLDSRMLGTPSVALQMAVKEIVHMGELVLDMMYKVSAAFFEGRMETMEQVEQIEEKVDRLQRETILYLSTLLSQSVLTEAQSKDLTGLMHSVSDVERVADHIYNIGGYAREKSQGAMPFSEEALAELRDMYTHVEMIFRTSIESLQTWDKKKVDNIWEMERQIDDIQERLRNNHIVRLNRGTCNPGSGVIYIESINDLERIADHSTNIAEVIAGRAQK